MCLILSVFYPESNVDKQQNNKRNVKKERKKSRSWLEDTIEKSTIVLLQKKFIWIFAILTQFVLIDGVLPTNETKCM